MRRLHQRHGHLLLYILLLLAVIMLMVALRTCSVHNVVQDDDDGRENGRDTLKVAMEFSPVGVYASGDTLSGFYYDLLRQLSAMHDVTVHVTGFSHGSDILPRLQDRSIDIVIADIPLTPELKNAYAFTQPVLTDRQVLVQLKDTVNDTVPINSQLELIGRTVYVPAHSYFIPRLENLKREMGGEFAIVEHPDYGSEQLVISVAIGETPNAVVNKRVASILMKDYPRLDASVELSLNQFQSWLLNKADTTLRDTIDAWLDAYRHTPQFEVLKQQYF